MLIDTHCHLDFPDFEAERDAIIERARAAGVGQMITISTRVKRFDDDPWHCGKLCQCLLLGRHASAQCGRGAGYQTADLVRLSAHPKVVAIGEAGLDYFYETRRAMRRR